MSPSLPPSDWTVLFLALPTELQLQIIQEMLLAATKWTEHSNLDSRIDLAEDPKSNAQTTIRSLRPMTTRFRIRQDRQQEFLELHPAPRERADWRTAQPTALSSIRNLVLDLSARDEGRGPRWFGRFDPAQGLFQAQVFANTVQHFSSLQRLELDVNTFNVCDRDLVKQFSMARLQPDLPKGYFAFHLLRDLYVGIGEMSIPFTGDG
nr:hypothetical protein B0A51_16131 [Rachicladosporium sp. CCFEE 5018]